MTCVFPGKRVVTLSCASAGNCAAGGSYIDYLGDYQAWLVSEVSGSWRSAVKLPGGAALNRGGYAQVYSVSCGAAGKCSAGGVYSDSSHLWHAFVINET